VILKFFIDGKNFECLKHTVPEGSICYAAITTAAHFSNVASSSVASQAVVTCDDVAARELLSHARQCCPGAVTRIAEAFRAAGLTP
jgi:hypothetical protein